MRKINERIKAKKIMKHDDCWDEMSYKKYSNQNRNDEYRLDIDDMERKNEEWTIASVKDRDYSIETLLEIYKPYGLYEDITYNKLFDDDYE